MAERPTLVAWSGGVGSSYALRWTCAQQTGPVWAVTVDTDGCDVPVLEAMREHALALGASEHRVISAQGVFYRELLGPLLLLGARVGGVVPWWIAEEYARAEALATLAREWDACALVHGSHTGDSGVPSELLWAARAPKLERFAPARGRSAKELDPEAAGEDVESVWGTRWPTLALQDPWEEPDEDTFARIPDPAEVNDLPEELTLEFAGGLPVAAGGQRMDPPNLFTRLNRLGERHGYGRGVHVRRTALGVLERAAYECPGLAIVTAAREALDAVSLTAAQLALLGSLRELYVPEFCAGRRSEPALRAVEVAARELCNGVDGEVRVRLARGTLEVQGARRHPPRTGTAVPVPLVEASVALEALRLRAESYAPHDDA
ncbi:MAG: argininosuccinate synthase [Planctomycetes bacterium]|nr:argininosuccinate synthase [Planctomycetota bacterium]